MFLGIRRIRSAGRTSGSIEITLPTELQVLLGVECHLLVRNGARPEIVLQPDLSRAQSIFQSLWDRLRLGLMKIDEIGGFALADFTLTLLPPPHWQDRPPLAYADGLAVSAWRCDDSLRNGRYVDALTHVLASLAAVAAHRLELKGTLALAFGDAVPYCLCGTTAGLSTEFELGMAHRVFWNGDTRSSQLGDPFDPGAWRQAQGGLYRVYRQFCVWQDYPETYVTARENWHRALSMEIGMQPSLLREEMSI